MFGFLAKILNKNVVIGIRFATFLANILNETVVFQIGKPLSCIISIKRNGNGIGFLLNLNGNGMRFILLFRNGIGPDLTGAVAM
jgi:hypothetical protein